MILYSHASRQRIEAAGRRHMRLMEITEATMQTHCNLSCQPADRVKSRQNNNKTYAHRIMTCVTKRDGGFCAHTALVTGVNISKIVREDAAIT